MVIGFPGCKSGGAELVGSRDLHYRANLMEFEKVLMTQRSVVYVPGGSHLFPDTLASDSIVLVRREVGPFYIDQKEVSNIEFLRFRMALLERGDSLDYSKFRPDSTRWIGPCGPGAPPAMVHMYHWHPAFNDYPVVNISKEQAEGYCTWLEQNLIRRMDSSQRMEYDLEVRLPTETEWVHAAIGWSDTLQHYSKGGSKLIRKCTKRELRERSRYSIKTYIDWEDNYHLYVCGDSLAEIRYNDDGILVCYSSGSGLYHPHHIKTGLTNAFGLYNMCGNVREMVMSDILEGTGRCVAKGGSWFDPPEKLNVHGHQVMEEANPFTGFRVVYDLKKRQKD